MEKVWKYKRIDNSDAIRLAKEYGLSTLMAKVLLARGISDRETIDLFLNSQRDLYDPFLMKDMDKAVDRICTAIDERQSITIYGDYDADGITSTACLLSFLRSLGAQADYYIPDRLTEGYGMSQEAIGSILKRGTELIITVDCGIASFEEADYLLESGADLIITDHHECSDKIPKAYAVVNPKRVDCNYPFKELAGVGVVYKLIHALCIKRGLKDAYKNYVDIAAVGTISDVVPLIDENRLIVKEGLEKLKNTENTGLKELMTVAGIKNEKLNTYSVAFGISPRINAGGRMGMSELALDLLLAKEKDNAKKMAEELNLNNRNRQVREQEIYDRLIEIIENNREYKNKNIIVVAEEGLHHGVIGIAASRISDKYYKPCIILSVDKTEDGGMIAKGSCRSIKGFNIYDALSKCSDLLEKYGGHELAAGLSLKPENIPEFDSRINYISREVDKSVFVPTLTCDTCIDENDITIDNIKSLSLLEPYGQSNPMPSFVLERATLLTARPVGAENRHMKMIFQKDKYNFDSIAFNINMEGLTLEDNHEYDIMFTLDINEWNNRVRPQIKIIDIRKTKNVDANDLSADIGYIIEYGKRELKLNSVENVRDLVHKMMIERNETINKNEILKYIADRSDMTKIYKYMYGKAFVHVCDISKDMNVSKFKAQKVIDTLLELDLAEGDFTKGFRLKNNRGKKVELEGSLTYKIMSIIKEAI